MVYSFPDLVSYHTTEIPSFVKKCIYSMIFQRKADYFGGSYGDWGMVKAVFD